MGEIEESPHEHSGWTPVPALGAGNVSMEPTPLIGMPVYLTRLIGRDGDRARLRELIVDQRKRLVVVTGTGGVGKTRLAVQAANDLQARFRHGTRFLPFASVPANANLDAAFAWHLGLRDVEGQSYRETITRYLQFREILLVVDNVEHVPRIADLLMHLQERCAAVVMLVTSRSALGIYGEVTHLVFPLTHRAAGSLLPILNPASLARGHAVQLFIERVRAVVPGFEITSDNAREVAAICDHLGGLPLAIELTAPRMAHHTPASLLAELEETIDPATPRPTAATKPVISMQDTIRLSYDQLTDEEQRVFRTLCIMCGQWSIDDVLPIMPPGIDEFEAITHLDTLDSRSLIASPSGAGDVLRFTINPVLRQFGRSELARRGEDTMVADRHAQRMIDLAEEAEPELTGSQQREWLARIDALYDDVRDAYAHLRRHGRAVEALRLGAALWRYAYTRGHYRKAREMIESSVRLVDDHDALRAHALNGAGLLANVIRDAAGARANHEQALELATRLGLEREIALSRIGLADVASSFENDTAAALRHLEHAAAAYERMHDPRGIASVLTNRGNIEWVQGHLDQALTTHEEARVLYAQASDARGMAWSDTNTGRIAAQQHRYHDAVPRLLAALERYVQIGDAYGLTEVLEALAGVAVGTDDLETASVLAGAATSMRAEIGSPLKSPDREEFQATLAAARQSPRHEEAFARGTRMSPEEAIAIARAFPVPAAELEPGGRDPERLAHERYGITKREYQVLLLLSDGLTDHEIAARLDISARTVQTYITAILRKLDVTSRVSAARAAHQAGLIPVRRHAS